MGEMDNIFGAAVCGLVAAAWITGLLCVFCYQYYQASFKDPKATKALVAAAWVLQILNVIVVTKMIYFYLVTSFANPAALGSATWEWSMYLGIEAVTATMVQLYYAWRILILVKSYLLFGVVVLLSIAQLAFGLGTMGVTIKLKLFSLFTPWTWICVSWLGCSAACDIVIAVVQVIYLHRSKSSMTGTNRMVNKLIWYIVSTGALTSVVAILELSTFAALGFNFVHVFLSFPNGAIYVISLMSNLNVRRTLRTMGPSTTNIASGSELGPMRFKSVEVFQSTDLHSDTMASSPSRYSSDKKAGSLNRSADHVGTESMTA